MITNTMDAKILTPSKSRSSEPPLPYPIPLKTIFVRECSLFTESSTVPPGNTLSEVFGTLVNWIVFSQAQGTQVYLDSGIYIGFLEVSTLEGCSSKENFVVEVFPKPIISFETTNYCPYEEIGFTPSNNYAVPLIHSTGTLIKTAIQVQSVFPHILMA